MGATTATAKVWYADTSDSAKLDTVTAAMASSIENGLGTRMTLRETQVGLKAGVSTAWSLPTTWAVVPMAVGTGNGMFNNGFTITAGVITIVTPGMYFVSGQLSITNVSGHSVKLEVRQNSTPLFYGETLSSATVYQFATGSTVINCVAGDTIAMYGADGVTTGATTVADSSKNLLSVVLVNATHA